MEKFIRQRIKENKNLFNEDEILQIEKNYTIMKKIYILGISDGKEIS